MTVPLCPASYLLSIKPLTMLALALQGPITEISGVPDPNRLPSLRVTPFIYGRDGMV